MRILTDPTPESPESIASALHAMVAERRRCFTGPNQAVAEDGTFIIRCMRCAFEGAGDSVGEVVKVLSRHIIATHGAQVES